MIQQNREDGGLPRHLSPEPAPSPNDLDQTDESKKAADIERAGEALAEKRHPEHSIARSPSSVTPNTRNHSTKE